MALFLFKSTLQDFNCLEIIRQIQHMKCIPLITFFLQKVSTRTDVVSSYKMRNRVEFFRMINHSAFTQRWNVVLFGHNPFEF